jgi:hypothetical protein
MNLTQTATMSLGFNPAALMAEAKKHNPSILPARTPDQPPMDEVRRKNIAAGLTGNGTKRVNKLRPELKQYRHDITLYHKMYMQMKRGTYQPT